MRFSEFSAQQPLWRMGNTPMDLTRTLIVVHIITALLVAIVIGSGGVWLDELACSAESLRSFKLWTPFTYPFVHMVSFSLAIDLVVLWWFGSEVETFVGRKAFAWMYGILAVLPAVALLLIAALTRDLSLVGAFELHFAVFVAFSLIHPRARLIFGIEAKWFAIVFLAVSLISDMAYHHWNHFLYTLVLLANVFGLMWRHNASGCLTIAGWFGLSGRRVGGGIAKARTDRKRRKDEEREQHVDEILDKVSEQGMHSLTEREKKVLRDASKRRNKP